MSVHSYDELVEHFGHEIHCVKYGDTNVALECVDCNVILVDYDKVEYDDVPVEINWPFSRIVKELIGHGIAPTEWNVEHFAYQHSQYSGWQLTTSLADDLVDITDFEQGFIVKKSGVDLYWKKDEGWCDQLDEATVYGESEDIVSPGDGTAIPWNYFF
jgi:hypothetical protein